MTETEWLSSADPVAMIQVIDRDIFWQSVPLAKSRKLRHFACACCRQVWHLLTDDSPCGRCGGSGVYDAQAEITNRVCSNCSGTGRINRSRRAVETVERFADGLATEEEARLAANAATQVNMHPTIALNRKWGGNEFTGVPHAVQADLLRHIVGNPFRKTTICGVPHDYPLIHCWDCRIIIDAKGWLIGGLAERIYNSDQSAIPILHDALLDAAAPDELVEHFTINNHPKGCCVLDLILGKS